MRRRTVAPSTPAADVLDGEPGHEAHADPVAPPGPGKLGPDAQGGGVQPGARGRGGGVLRDSALHLHLSGNTDGRGTRAGRRVVSEGGGGDTSGEGIAGVRRMCAVEGVANCARFAWRMTAVQLDRRMRRGPPPEREGRSPRRAAARAGGRRGLQTFLLSSSWTFPTCGWARAGPARGRGHRGEPSRRRDYTA